VKEIAMRHSTLSVLLAICALATQGQALAQAVRPGSVVRINPGGSPAQTSEDQPDKAFKPEERDKAMGKNPVNGCPCSSANRCYHSLDFNYCIAPDGHREYIQRYWVR
jgi:hypothetical protein